MAHIAFLTIGVLHDTFDGERSRGFVDRIAASFASAEGSDGFVARAGGRGVDFGPQRRPPAFAAPEYADRTPQTLSLWRDLEAAFAFSYAGAHAEALQGRHEWFARIDAPAYVAWWVDDGHVPSWDEAHERWEALRAQGPSPRAFDFRRPFDAQGRPYVLDRAAARARAPSRPS
jgi:hypothetical protein